MSHKHIDWDNYFMGVAKLSALRSKDPSTQVGACIINTDKRIIGIGYNGLPHGCQDDLFPWSVKEGQLDETKYAYVVHAEANAILNSTQSLKDSSLYVTLFPCNECMKLIIQSGIKEIFFESDKHSDKPSHHASLKMMNAAGIKASKMTFKEIILKAENL